jgi:signal transduction histidine kinase
MMSAGILVAHGNLTPGDDRVVSRLLNSARRMERIIAQILDFTRSRLGGGVLLDLRPTNVGDICQNVASELSLSRSVSIQCSVEGDVTASLDPDRIADVISNIAGNASEHAREGTSVSIQASGEGAHVVVVISNEGAPIPPEVLPFIFDPFRRARQNEVSKAGNLGLGLYIAREVTRAHRGSIDVESAEGKTMFTLRLPRFPPPPPSGALKSERG